MVTLLIADDEQLERQALRHIIEKNCTGIVILGETGDGASAIRIAAAEKPDIILMDIRMPELNGLEAAKVIRSMLPAAEIVILTAFDEFNYAKQALSLGATEYLMKPVRPHDLVSTLQSVAAKITENKRKLREEAELRKSLDEARPFIQMAFVYDLISGHFNDPADLRARAALLGMKNDPGIVLVADVDLFKPPRSESEMEKQNIKQYVFETICSVVGAVGIAAPFGGDCIVVLLAVLPGTGSGQAKTAAIAMALRMKEAVEQKLGIGLVIGIGRYYADLPDISKSYLEAVKALQERFYLDGSSVIHFEDMPTNVNPFHYPFSCERTVADKVRCGERKQAQEALLRLLNEIFDNRAGIGTVKASVLELLIVLSRAAVEGGANFEQLTLLNVNRINQLMTCSDCEQVGRWMLDTLNQLMDNMLAAQSKAKVRLINKACEYIGKHCNRELPLDHVAQMVHLSPYYFSRLFKREKNCTFVAFLTQVRIERAKRLLQNSDLTVARIAKESGYRDAGYFCRVFRQEEGVTPNQYRSERRIERNRENAEPGAGLSAGKAKSE